MASIGRVRRIHADPRNKGLRHNTEPEETTVFLYFNGNSLNNFGSTEAATILLTEDDVRTLIEALLSASDGDKYDSRGRNKTQEEVTF